MDNVGFIWIYIIDNNDNGNDNDNDLKPFGGLLKWGGTPIAGLFHGKSIYKWMMTGGSPIL
jgi:hypothetical protein